MLVGANSEGGWSGVLGGSSADEGGAMRVFSRRTGRACVVEGSGKRGGNLESLPETHPGRVIHSSTGMEMY